MFWNANCFYILELVNIRVIIWCYRYRNGVPVGSGGRMRVIKEDDVFIFVINEIYDKDDRGRIYLWNFKHAWIWKGILSFAPYQ